MAKNRAESAAAILKLSVDAARAKTWSWADHRVLFTTITNFEAELAHLSDMMRADERSFLDYIQLADLYVEQLEALARAVKKYVASPHDTTEMARLLQDLSDPRPQPKITKEVK